MPKPETLLISAILQYLKIKGYVCKRNQSGMTIIKGQGKNRAIRMGEPGWPDIIGMDRKGRFFAIEAKVLPNRTTEAQDAILKAIAESGGLAIVAYELEDVIKAGL